MGGTVETTSSDKVVPIPTAVVDQKKEAMQLQVQKDVQEGTKDQVGKLADSEADKAKKDAIKLKVETDGLKTVLAGDAGKDGTKLETTDKALVDKAFEAALVEVAKKYEPKGITVDMIRTWIFGSEIDTQITGMIEDLGGKGKKPSDVKIGDLAAGTEKSEDKIRDLTDKILGSEVKGMTAEKRVEALQKKLNDFKALLVENPGKDTPAAKFQTALGESGVKDLRAALADGDFKKALAEQDKESGNLKTDGRLGKRTLMMLSIYKRACDALGNQQEEVKKPEKKEDEVKTDIKEISATKIQEVDFTNIKLTTVTKGKDVTYTLAFESNSAKHTIVLDETTAKAIKDLKAGEPLPPAVTQQLAQFKDKLFVESFYRKSTTQKASKDGMESIGRHGVNYLLSKDGSTTGKDGKDKLNEDLGYEVEISQEQLDAFNKDGRISFTLDWEGGDYKGKEHDPEITLARNKDTGVITMTVQVRGATNDPLKYGPEVNKCLGNLKSAKTPAEKLKAKSEAVQTLKSGIDQNDKTAQGDPYYAENGNIATFTFGGTEKPGEYVGIKDTLANLKTTHKAWVELWHKVY